MIDPRVFLCEPLLFNDKIKIYPPKVKDIVINPKFGQFLKVLTLSQEDLEDELTEKGNELESIPTPFEFLLINCYHSPDFFNVVKEAFKFFIHEEISIIYEYKKIIVGNLEQLVTKIQSIEDLVTIEEQDFFNFQNAIRVACGEKELKPPEEKDPNEDPRITEIKRRARKRDRIKAKHNKDGISISTCLVAICCMGIGITPLNIGEMSYASIGAIMRMSQEKEKYDIDIRSLLAGADSKKVKPKYWIRNSDKE